MNLPSLQNSGVWTIGYRNCYSKNRISTPCLYFFRKKKVERRPASLQGKTMSKKNSGIRKNDAKPREMGLNSHIARFLQEAAKGFSEQDLIKVRNEPMVYGFNLVVGQDGVPKFEVFGNLSPKASNWQQTGHDHLIDVIDRDNKITVLAELPGTLREHLTIKASESELIIEASMDGKKYRRTVILPKVVDPDTASAQINNGVLEVIFNKAYIS